MQRLSHKPESTMRCMQSDLLRVREVLYQNQWRNYYEADEATTSSEVSSIIKNLKSKYTAARVEMAITSHIDY